MRAAVIHHSLNTPGGETTVAIETIQSLYDIGFEVDLVTVQKPDLESIFQVYGKRIPIRNVKSLFPFKLNYFGIYQRLLTNMSSLRHSDLDIIINTHGNAMPRSIPPNIPCILYLHFPASLMNYAGYNNNKYQKSFFWTMYFKPYQVIANTLTKRALKRSNIVLTNSEFTRNAVKKAYPDVDPYVLYPPGDIERFSSSYRSNARKRQVLVLSRFSPEKHIEISINVARLLGNVKFKVIGSLIPINRPYFNYLDKMIQDYGLKDKITLIPNATNEEIIDAMSESMVYLHTMYGEHFGVSIIEAMAAGLMPIIPSYGGCSEIVPPEYQYTTLKDAASCISRNIDEYDNKKRTYVYDIAKQFSTSRFRKMMQQYIEQAYNGSNGSSSTDNAD